MYTVYSHFAYRLQIVGMGCEVELNIEGSVSKPQSNMRDDAS